MTVSLEVRSLSKLSFSTPPSLPPLFFCLSLLLFRGVPTSLSLPLSLKSSESTWLTCCSRMKSTAEGNPKANNTKNIHERTGKDTAARTHTHTQTQWSPKDYHQHDTGHFREDSICSLPYLIPQKRTLCSQETSHFHFETNTAAWTHIILCELHISAVQEAIEKFPSVQVHSHWD